MFVYDKKGAGCRRLPVQQMIACKADICLQPDVRNRFICMRDGSISYYGRQGSKRPEWQTISLKPKLHLRPCLSPPAATLASWSTVLYNMPIAYNKRTFFGSAYIKCCLIVKILSYIVQTGRAVTPRSRMHSNTILTRFGLRFSSALVFTEHSGYPVEDRDKLHQ